jgi:hypothetical protein
MHVNATLKDMQHIRTNTTLIVPSADSDDAAHPFRDDRADHSEMMPPI